MRDEAGSRLLLSAAAAAAAQRCSLTHHQQQLAWKQLWTHCCLQCLEPAIAAHSSGSSSSAITKAAAAAEFCDGYMHLARIAPTAAVHMSQSSRDHWQLCS